MGLKILNLSKLYKKTKKKKTKAALNKVSFGVDRGSIFCLLGPNGAGKSSLLNIICGMQSRTEGIAEINNSLISE